MTRDTMSCSGTRKMAPFIARSIKFKFESGTMRLKITSVFFRKLKLLKFT